MATTVATDWEMVVGLEVHTELATATKLFCACPNAFGDPPNTNVCPVCLGLPGSLPVLNRQAVELAMRVGLALHCRVEPSIFHRKNYFYPDMPKDYQVSQYDEPINVGGWLELPDGSRVGITRAHMEEDTGKSTHVGGEGGRISGADHSLVDYNRAGVPLVEIVSEPDIRSSEQAKAYVNELRAILVAIGASDARMEEGSLRIDANISMRPVGSAALGTRAEIKNLNSVRSLGRAVEYEARRQVALLEAGEVVVQETRHWNEDDGRTSSMRSKEEAYDYRYFPEPDLVALAPPAEWLGRVRAGLPALPAERRSALLAAAGLDASGAWAAATVVQLGLDDLVLSAIGAGADGRLALNRAANELAGGPAPDPAAFAKVLRMEGDGQLTATQAKAVLAQMVASGGDPEDIARVKGFEALAGDVVAEAVDAAIAGAPEEWGRYVGGEAKLAGFFVGKVMAATKGKADGKAVTALLQDRRSSPPPATV
ncbi:MAG TPA: Asp-tRNA(Asn)/Glu-tRNA(Gln) amidotransferase subunit GatB [Acidimicrobiales bacterium]|jgi:aspartyl-tRNA(Asn)/glutamyl-tRNA(Gln) amidotransferase subunit B|nr:Asp-tRNA(Asn)/Glu-tRNA(Gln) amidotransferase subunit GatB [Acidimicrobiales bacterium]